MSPDNPVNPDEQHQPTGRAPLAGSTALLATAGVVAPNPIQVGLNPLGMATAGTQIYAANSSASSVSVIDTTTQTVRSTITVGTTPWGITASPDGQRIYVSNSGQNTVSIINTTTTPPTVTAVPVGSNPQGLALTPDGHRLYVANSGQTPDPTVPGTVSVIDLTANPPTVTSITVGKGPAGVAITPDGRRVYVANSSSNTVSIIDPTTNTVTATLPVGTGPLGVAVTPNGVYTYVTNHTPADPTTPNGTVSVIANWAPNPSVTNTIPTGTRPSVIAIASDGRHGYVTNTGSNTITIFTTVDSKTIGEIPVPNSPFGAAIPADGTNLYVAQSDVNTISIIPLTPVDIASTWNTDGNPATDARFNFLGTRDQQPLVIKTNNAETLRINPRTDGGQGHTITIDNDAINVGQLNAQANTGTGVTGSSTGGDGVRGSASDQRSGVWGNNTGNGSGVVGTSNTGNGVLGRTGGAANSGVYGNNTGGGPGVTGSSTSSNGVAGISTGNLASGVYGENNGQGWGIAGRTNAPYAGASGRAAVYGDNTAGGLAGLFNGMVVVDNARRPGDEAFIVNPGPNRIGAFLGSNDGNYITGGLAVTGGDVSIDKDLYVRGNIHKSSGGFRIDHPHDPANRYLTHSFVESNEMKNVYDGAVELDASGQAVVELPEWFGTINEDFRYQLTAIGRPAPNLHIAEEITDNHFTIAGGDPGMKVSWQVTGVRADPWARANRMQVETDKPEHERDRYLHPELYGHNADKQIGQLPATFADRPPSGNQT